MPLHPLLRRGALLGRAAAVLVPATVSANATIPAFARKYGVSCSACHAPVPRLNAVGEQFAENGFEFSTSEQPRDTIATGDPLLRLQREIPLAVRLDAYATALSSVAPDEARVDLLVPYGIKLLSGGQIADGVSYSMYFYLAERGEVAGLEDAYIQFTDILGSGVSVLAGQFQVSDPLVKRELRLEYEDYQPYRVRGADPVAGRSERPPLPDRAHQLDLLRPGRDLAPARRAG